MFSNYCIYQLVSNLQLILEFYTMCHMSSISLFIAIQNDHNYHVISNIKQGILIANLLYNFLTNSFQLKHFSSLSFSHRNSISFIKVAKQKHKELIRSFHFFPIPFYKKIVKANSNIRKPLS